MDNPIYAYPLDKLLEALGSRKGEGKDMWYSPFRDESNASLHVNRQANVWYDQGAGIGGTNVNLVMLIKHCNKAEAENFIKSLDPDVAERITPAEADKKSSEIIGIRDITNPYLLNYLQRRKIPVALAGQYCKEIIVRNHEKKMNFTLLGFPNNRGGYAMSSPHGFKSTNKAAPTFINNKGEFSSAPSSKSVAIFEGFFDFLSWQVMQSSKTPSSDVVVLNSVNNLGKAKAYIGQHDKAHCFLDNDTAGERCYQGVRDIMYGKETIDLSDLYGGHKDLNEMLQASRGYTANMHLAPGM